MAEALNSRGETREEEVARDALMRVRQSEVRRQLLGTFEEQQGRVLIEAAQALGMEYLAIDPGEPNPRFPGQIIPAHQLYVDVISYGDKHELFDAKVSEIIKRNEPENSESL